MSKIDLTINKEGLLHNIQKAKENNIIIPTIAQCRMRSSSRSATLSVMRSGSRLACWSAEMKSCREFSNSCIMEMS